MANARPSRPGDSQASEEDSLAASKSEDVRVVIGLDGARGPQANFPKKMELRKKVPGTTSADGSGNPGWYETETIDNRGKSHKIIVEDY